MCCVLVHVHPNKTQQANQINHIKQTWATYNPHRHACVYHVRIVCVKCMHMHVHCICVLPFCVFISLHGIVHNKHCCKMCKILGHLCDGKKTSTSCDGARKPTPWGCVDHGMVQPSDWNTVTMIQSAEDWNTVLLSKDIAATRKKDMHTKSITANCERVPSSTCKEHSKGNPW